MAPKQDDKLLKRIANLVRQNKELEKQLKDICIKYEELLEKMELGDKSLSKRSKAEKSDKSDHLRFDMATVLFANINGFSKISKYSNKEELMDELDQIFMKFDEILDNYNIQKIKTIGDAYMCAGGIPVKNITNPVEVVLAALLIQYYINKSKVNNVNESKIWDFCYGIHTGPVIATESGKKKISYDIKGDTVNVATRIESAADPGKVMISVMTYELVKEFFICEFHSKLPTKYKDDLELYEVKGLRPEFLDDPDKLEPNENFRTKFLLMQFTDIQEFMLNKLEKELPAFLFYHNVKHTVDVVTQVELIGWGEGVSDEEILLLKTAALFHDAGHTIGYDNHEYNSTVIVRELLPAFNYNQSQIDAICDIIMATKLPPNPQNLLQKIICDADLDYLGRTDFIPVSNTLYEELKEQHKIGSLSEWNNLQIKFLSGHQFFTKTAKSLREVNKQKQIERLHSIIE